MRKMPTLFKRVFDNHDIKETLNEVTEGCEWVLNGEGVATRKWDGTCMMIQDGKLFKRYDAKHGKPIPKNAIPCQEEADAITGHFPCWLPVDFDDKANKWMVIAYEAQIERGFEFTDGTYELCGPHFNSNRDGFEFDAYIKHGLDILDIKDRTYEGIKAYLSEHKIEGIVFHRGNGEMCKIKRSDFGFEWGKKRGE